MGMMLEYLLKWKNWIMPNWPMPQQWHSEIHYHVSAQAMLSTGCSQPRPSVAGIPWQACFWELENYLGSDFGSRTPPCLARLSQNAQLSKIRSLTFPSSFPSFLHKSQTYILGWWLSQPPLLAPSHSPLQGIYLHPFLVGLILLWHLLLVRPGLTHLP